MSSSRRQQHPAARRRPRSSSAGRCGSRTRLLEEWWRLVAERAARRATRWTAKLALARCIVARSHGEEAAARGRGALHARRARGAGARTRCRRRRCRTATRAPAGAARRARSGSSTSEARRLIAQGGVRVDGEPVVDELDVPARAARGRGRPGGQAALRAARREPLDTRLARLLLFPGRLDRGGVESPCHSTTGAPSDAESDTTRIRVLGGLWRESEAFFRRHSGTGL